MSESTTEAEVGWGRPLNSRKAHYFAVDGHSLCGRWFFLGPLSDDNHDSPATCKACRCSRETREEGGGVMTVGTKLRLYRKQHTLHLHDLATRLDVSISYLSEIERGRRVAPLSIVQRLATVYGVRPIDLVLGTDEWGLPTVVRQEGNDL